MRIAYFDCFAGAGGDMIAGAMLDAGVDAQFLKDQLDSLGIEGLEIAITRVSKCGIEAVKFTPVAAEAKKHRHLKDIVELIENSSIADAAKERAVKIFGMLAEVEAEIHNTTAEKIHFHEVGAADSIVDVVSACVGIFALGVEKVYCSAVSVGAGTVKCDHGVMPVPAPATAEIVRRAKMPVRTGPAEVELLTPTAAAILAEFVTEFGAMPAMQIESIGYGAGTYDSCEFANTLRLLVGTASEDETQSDSVCLLETNIDDATGEVMGFVMEGLFERSALDVFCDPIQMKRNRPAVKLSVLCKIEDVGKIEEYIFGQGVTSGIRKQIVKRAKLEREFVTVQTRYGAVNIKVGFYNGKEVIAKPEYSECAKIAKEQNIGIKSVMSEAMSAYQKITGASDKC
ncbi:MAG: nickel pincer cofactor biosynthesis protein LarC [Planctomycetes bacterium]|nr:nickel pincer cofactor biosynthesis protein LarC [Planctomycetota bacterium]